MATIDYSFSLPGVILTKMTLAIRDYYKAHAHKITFFSRRSSGEVYRTGEQQHRRQSQLLNVNNNNMFISLPIVNVPLPLSSEQLAFLDYGLKYVQPCRSRFSQQLINEIIKQVYTKIHKRISDNLYNYCITSSDQRAVDQFVSMKQLLQQLYTTPLPPRLAARVQYNHRMVQSIKHRLQQANVIVRPTDKSKVFYLLVKVISNESRTNI